MRGPAFPARENVTHPRTPRVVRIIRWTRTLGHVATATVLLRVVFPRATRGTRRRLTGWWSAKLLRILNITVVVEGTPPPDHDESAFVAANHISWADIPLISSVRPTRFVAKSEIRDWPVAGWICERAGTIFIRRARRHDTARINDLVHAALVEGDCVGLFPEGTTTEGDRLLKFHSSLFEPAVANAAHVYPAAIRYEHPDGTPCRAAAYVGEISFVQSLGLVIRQRETVARITFGERIPPDGRTRREVAAHAFERVASLLSLPGPDRAPRTASGREGEPR